MAGVATKPTRKKPEKFAPTRSSRIPVVEDPPEGEERIAVPLESGPVPVRKKHGWTCDYQLAEVGDKWQSGYRLDRADKSGGTDMLAGGLPGSPTYESRGHAVCGAMDRAIQALSAEHPQSDTQLQRIALAVTDLQKFRVETARKYRITCEPSCVDKPLGNGRLPTETELIDRFLREALPPAVRRQILAQQSRDVQLHELVALCRNMAIGSRTNGDAIEAGPYDLHAQQSTNMTAIIKWEKVLDRLREPNGRGHVHPGLTGNSTPAGIAQHDPSAEDPTPPANGRPRKSRPVVCDCPEAAGGAHLPTCDVVRRYTQAVLRTRPAELLGKLISIPVDEIRPNPFQPRQEFDQAELEELAASIKVHGIRQPLDVRLVDDDYELVAGERRLRAAKLAGLAEVPAVLKVTSDKEAREIALIENLQRKDLSDIEKARAFKRLIDEDGYTVEQLAERLKGPDGAKRSRSYVANLLRLLELPAEWQQRVVSHEMPSTHARYLLPYKEAPAILKAVDKHVRERGLPSLKEWDEELNRIVREAAQPLSKQVHSFDWKHHGDLRIDPKHPQYCDLQVVEVKSYNGKQKVALNAPLARKLLSEKAKAWHEKHPSKNAKAKAGKGPTPAEKAAAAKAERERLQGTLRKIVARWLLTAFVDRITDDLPRPTCERLLLYFALCGDGRSMSAGQDLVVKRCSLKVTWKNKKELVAERILGGRDDLLAPLLKHVFASEAEDLSRQGWVRVQPGDLSALLAIAGLLEVDPARRWMETAQEGHQVMMGSLTEEYFEAHSEEQLRVLCEDEWNLDFPAKRDKGDLVTLISQSQNRRLPLPAELADLVGGKTTAKRPRKAK